MGSQVGNSLIIIVIKGIVYDTDIRPQNHTNFKDYCARIFFIINIISLGTGFIFREALH